METGLPNRAVVSGVLFGTSFSLPKKNEWGAIEGSVHDWQPRFYRKPSNLKLILRNRLNSL